MNILLVSSKSAYTKGKFGGIESSMRLLAEYLGMQEHNVYYVTEGGRGTRPRWKIKAIGGVEVHFFGRIRSRGFLPVSGLNKILYERYLKRIIREFKIDIIYCPYELKVLSPLLRAKESNSHLKLVMRMAGLKWYIDCKRRPELIRVYNNVFKQVDAVNYIHKKLKHMVHEKLEELGIPQPFQYEFVGDIGAGISPGRPQPYHKLKNDKFTMIMASRFADYAKRQDIIVRAVSKIDPDIQIRVKLIGDGEEGNKIGRLIRKLGVGDMVEIIPFLEQKQLWAEMLEADLMCHACDYEGLGKIIVESMALGLPVLASDVPPLNDYIKEGYNGFLIDNDPVLWAKKIEELVADQKSRAEVSKNSMAYIKENYNPARNVKVYEKAFKEIVGCTRENP